MLFELFESAGVILSLALIYRFILRWKALSGLLATVIYGALFGGLAVLGMSFPVEVEPGVIFDPRTVVLLMSAVFCGLPTSVIAAFIATGYRLHLGGDGAIVGVAAVWMAIGYGNVYRALLSHFSTQVSLGSLFILGTLVHTTYLGMLLWLPGGDALDVIRNIALPMLASLTPATMLLGAVFKAFHDEIDAETQIRRLNEAKQAGLEKVVHVLSAALEARDPYTAGHEANVAKYAEMIGRALGYDAHRLDGLRLAATIHDVGKIRIPTEILTKPDRLSPPEFDLIKCHPEVGAELLNGVEFDWPIAEIIKQHHERMDGSGYPLGLKGEEILEEARIIAVADTVDAVAAFRPYRQARGVQAARQILVADKGCKYDQKIVEACVALIDNGTISSSP